MIIRKTPRAVAAAAMILAAGCVTPVFAQTPRPVTPVSKSMHEEASYCSARWMSSLAVMNNNAEQVANVSDLLLDRGSGRIEYVVIKTGGMLGLGGRRVALPYSSFSTDPADPSRMMLAVTPEQLKQFPEYSAEDWKTMRQARKDDATPLAKRLAADASSPADPFSGTLSAAKADRVEGEITNVDRIATSTFGEQVEITVKTADGSSQRIALGPSWFVNVSPDAPMRGDKVVVRTLALPRDADSKRVATSLRAGDRELKLREDDGHALWSSDAAGLAAAVPHLRYVLLSEVTGMTVDCRGVTCGKVDDLIADRGSGEIRFISIDPNQNFLGVGDTKRLIPWSVASVTERNNVRLDASKEMVLASIETPLDVSSLRASSEAQRVYGAFGVPVPQQRDHRGAATGVSGCWSADGIIIRNMDASSRVSLSGRVVEVTDVQLGGAHGEARALKVRLDGAGQDDRVVLIGPKSGGTQAVPCKAGDKVTLDAVRTKIDGREHWLACTVTCDQKLITLVRSDNTPAW